VFNVTATEAFHRALAAVFRQVMAQDGEDSAREKHKFVNLFTQRFGMDHEAAVALYHGADAERDMTESIRILQDQLAGRGYERMQVMETVNELIQADGTGPDEYDLFEILRMRLFPDSFPKDAEL
jgi:uncharacterized tellurite resistance protein B-like protein